MYVFMEITLADLTAFICTIKNRKMFIDFSNQNNLSIKCIHVNTSLLESLKRNKLRETTKQVPNIAYSVYSKYYETPTESEGFKLISVSF